MNRVLISLLLLPPLLTGCLPDSNDDDSSATVSVGQFSAFDVSGLNYRTRTQSGVLVDGAYQYMAGETVTMSLLGTDLFEFNADSPEALVNLASEFPNQESDFNAAFLENEQFPDFQRLANTIQLLANLDADENIANGFDVTAYSNIGDIETVLDLSIPPFEFYEQTLIILAHELDTERNITPMISISQLYEWAQRDMLVYVPASYSLDSNNDGTVDQHTVYTYSVDGYLQKYTVYDENNLITDEVTLESDAMGRISSERFPRYDTEGTLTLDRGYDYFYNDSGQLIQYFSFYDFNADGIADSSFTEEYEYDGNGRLSVETVYSNGDRHVTSFDYNSEGLLTTQTEHIDDNNDGAYERENLSTYEYNESGLETLYRLDSDDDMDDVTDEYQIKTTTYTESGQIASLITQNFDNEDVIEYQSNQSYQYNNDGCLIEDSLATDYDNDSVADTLLKTTYTVNTDCQNIESTQQVFNDGVTLSKQVYTLFQDPELGYLGIYTKYQDNDGDGVTDYQFYSEITYDEFGNMLTRLTQTDSDNDGTFDSEARWSYDYILITDGAGPWLFDYYSN